MKQVLLFVGLAVNLIGYWIVSPLPSRSQIVPDQTLPVNSVVTPSGESLIITGGTSANGTLFHSFEQFSVPMGQAAFFNNDAEIRNILTRITGGTISEIDGLLRGNGSANLFLLNPNGIVFGPNARLDIGGSFFASTGSQFVFADGSTYSATTPNAPPLITLNVPLGVQFGPNPGAIANRSQVAIPLENQTLLPVGLQVSPGQSLILLGGEVILEGGLLTAPAGQITIAAVEGNSQVSVNPNPLGIQLGYEGVQGFQDVRLSRGAAVSTTAPIGGDIQVQGRQISLQDGSFISTAALGAGNAGNITLTATESVEILGDRNKLDFLEAILGSSADSAGVFDVQLLQGGGLFAIALGEGASGNITLDTGELRASNGAIVTTATLGNGIGGNLRVNATESVRLNNAGLLTGTAGVGNAGPLEINTGQITLESGAIVATPSLSSGRGGDITINADRIELTGTSTQPYNFPQIFNQPNSLPSSIFTQALGSGDAGNLQINGQQLTLSQEATISTSTLSPFAAARGGNLTLNVDQIQLNGVPGTGKIGLLEQIFAGNENPNLIDASLIQNGIFAISFGLGNAGTLNIRTQELTATNGAIIAASAFQQGTGGNLTVTTPLDGSVNLSNGGLLTGTAGVGNAGNLEINTGQITLESGAIVATPSLSSGRGGDLTINADRIQLTGTSPQPYNFPAPIFIEPNSLPSSIFTQALGSGDAGNLQINAQQLTLFEEATISTSTLSPFNAARGGNLTLNVDQIQLNGVPGTGKIGLLERIFAGNENPDLMDENPSAIDATLIQNGIFAISFGLGNAGELDIRTQELTATNGAVIATSTFQQGPGGNLTVTTPIDGSVNLDNGGLLTGTAGMQAAGNLEITTGQLELERGGIIATSTLGPGGGGNLTVNAQIVQLSGLSEESYDLPIFLQGPEQTPLDAQPIPTSLLTLTFGFDPLNPSGNAGNLTINSDRLLVENNAAISTSTIGAAGSAGDLTITADTLVQLRGTTPLQETLTGIFDGKFSLANVRNGLFTSSFGTGTPGNLTLTTPAIQAENGSLISASSLFPDASGVTAVAIDNPGGNLTIRASDSIRLNNSGLLTGTVNAQNSGALTLETRELIAENGSVAATTTLTQGRGGQLQVNSDSVTLRGINQNLPSGLFTLSFGMAQAGDLEINTENFTAENGGLAASSTFAQGPGGNLTLNAANQVLLRGSIPPGGNFPSGLRADALETLPPFAANLPIPEEIRGRGTPGNLTLNGRSVLVREGATVLVNAGPEGNGGNLAVNTGVLVLLDNSTMAANAGRGQGGNVEINTREGIFAVDRPNQITATSELGTQFSGRVEFNTPDVEAAQGLANLPENPIDPEDRVRSPLCSPAGESSAGEFRITGRGGLPNSPYETINRDGVQVQLVEPVPTVHNRGDGPPTVSSPAGVSTPLPPPARGLAVNAAGDVMLTATAEPGRLSEMPWFTAHCDRAQTTQK